MLEPGAAGSVAAPPARRSRVEVGKPLAKLAGQAAQAVRHRVEGSRGQQLAQRHRHHTQDVGEGAQGLPERVGWGQAVWDGAGCLLTAAGR